jgi:hypothetical protein
MSRQTRPISPTRFREAIHDLAIGNLHGKAAELRNSIDHLKRSNLDLAEFQDDADCKQAVAENLETIQRMEDRILMLKQEVQGRGLRWVEGDDFEEGMLEPGEQSTANGANGSGPVVNGISNTSQATAATTSNAPSGRLTDEQLRTLLAERMAHPEDEEEEDGVHL